MRANYAACPFYQEIVAEIERLFIKHCGTHLFEQDINLNGLMVSALIRRKVLTFEEGQVVLDSANEVEVSRLPIAEVFAEQLLEKLQKL